MYVRPTMDVFVAIEEDCELIVPPRLIVHRQVGECVSLFAHEVCLLAMH